MNSFFKLGIIFWLFSCVGCDSKVEEGEKNSLTTETADITIPDSPDTLISASVVSPEQAQVLLASYPDFLDRFEEGQIVWKDGTRMQWEDGREDKSFEEKLANPDLQDMMSMRYPQDSVRFQENFDPGRIRHQAFFLKMYGESAKAVEDFLVDVPWMGHKLRFSSINGAAAALQRVSNAFDSLPNLRKYLEKPGGTFVWRKIAGTDRFSAHSFGIAIDINTSFTNYWRWASEFKKGEPLKYRNRIPLEIMEIFEAEGFIWGGKWFHYDTMHFEYRPELLHQ